MSENAKNCLLTRHPSSAPGTIRVFEQFGLHARNLALIETVPTQAYMDANPLNLLNNTDFVIFGSPRGAEFFCEKIENLPPKIVLIAVGPGTARVLTERLGRQALVPVSYDQEGLADLIKNGDFAGKRGLYFGAEAKRHVLADHLPPGVEVVDFSAYTTGCRNPGTTQVKSAVKWADAVCFFSPSGVRCMGSAVGGEDKLIGLLAGRVVAAIGHVTAAALANLGVNAITPDEHTPKGMARLLNAAFSAE